MVEFRLCQAGVLCGERRATYGLRVEVLQPIRKCLGQRIELRGEKNWVIRLGSW